MCTYLLNVITKVTGIQGRDQTQRSIVEGFTGQGGRQESKLDYRKQDYRLVYFSSQSGLPNSLVGKESICNIGDPGSVLGLGRSPGEGIGYPLQYSGLENSMHCIVHRAAKSWT